MKLVSCNVNGIRSASKKGFVEFFDSERPDIFCLQEIKARVGDIPENLVKKSGYYPFFHPAERKGYSGVAVYTKQRPTCVRSTIGLRRFDSEGRLLELHFPEFVLLNIYFPNGGREKEQLPYKLEVYRNVLEYCRRNDTKHMIIVGDFNIAHTDMDLARPRENRNNIMFTPEERRQLDAFHSLGFVDSYRQFHSEPGRYTWWSYAFHAKEKNIGWRIDYAFVSSAFSGQMKQASIYADVRFSDHCPIGIEF